METLFATFFQLTPTIRYIALYTAGQLEMRQRPHLAHASSSESDRYEELLVNPALLLLTRQRGNIDCGGLRYVLVRYGSFFQLVLPLTDGHISMAFEPDANPLEVVEQIIQCLLEHGLQAGI